MKKMNDDVLQISKILFSRTEPNLRKRMEDGNWIEGFDVEYAEAVVESGWYKARLREAQKEAWHSASSVLRSYVQGLDDELDKFLEMLAQQMEAQT